LYYRVNVIHIELPSLRERPDDIPLLAEHFLRSACTEYSREVSGFSTQAMNAMVSYAWPGNIRELENAIQRAVLLTKSKHVDFDALPRALHGAPSKNLESPNIGGASPASSLKTAMPTGAVASTVPTLKQTLSEALEGPERQIILDVLRANGWNRNETADQLGINRTTLYKKMKKLGIETLENEPIP
jgi:DNA-binding NtrC family response regulator